MTVDLVLNNAKICVDGEVIEAGLAIDNGRIMKISKETSLPAASQKMNMKGLLVLPGLIDAHVHLRDEGLAYKEDFSTGTSAAANGGVTLVIDMPNNRPVTMDHGALRQRMKEAATKVVTNVAFQSAFPDTTAEMRKIVDEGTKAFKFFMSQKIGGIDPEDNENLVKTFREISMFNVPICIHAEDKRILEEARASIAESKNDLRDYAKLHPTEAEIKAIDRIIKLARESGANAHVCHVSTKKGIAAVSSAKRTGLPITCEVTPHHLLLSSHYMIDYGGIAVTNPPLRANVDISSLWSALQAGQIDILVSDHAPHAIEEKRKSSILEIAPGISGIETLLPLMLTQVDAGRLPIQQLVEMTSEKPAKIFGIKERGSLKKGNFADITVVDCKKEWTIDSAHFYSRAKYSPFDGWKVRGRPVRTFVNGLLVMEDGEVVGKPGQGQVIR